MIALVIGFVNKILLWYSISLDTFAQASTCKPKKTKGAGRKGVTGSRRAQLSFV